MAAILNSAISDSDIAMLDSDTLLSSLRFTPKHSTSTLTLTQTNSFWFTWWCQPSWILPSWIQLLHCGIQTPCFLLSDSLKNTLPPLWLWLKLIQSDSNSFIHTYLMMAAIWNSYILESPLHFGIQTPCFFLSDSLKHILTLLWLWFKLIQTDSNSFILTQLGDGSHFEFCHLRFWHCNVRFRHLVIFSQIHSKTLSLYSDSDSN